MTSLIGDFVERVDFDSYEDFYEYITKLEKLGFNSKNLL